MARQTGWEACWLHGRKPVVSVQSQNSAGDAAIDGGDKIADSAHLKYGSACCCSSRCLRSRNMEHRIPSRSILLVPRLMITSRELVTVERLLETQFSLSYLSRCRFLSSVSTCFEYVVPDFFLCPVLRMPSLPPVLRVLSSLATRCPARARQRLLRRPVTVMDVPRRRTGFAARVPVVCICGSLRSRKFRG